MLSFSLGRLRNVSNISDNLKVILYNYNNSETMMADNITGDFPSCIYRVSVTKIYLTQHKLL